MLATKSEANWATYIHSKIRRNWIPSKHKKDNFIYYYVAVTKPDLEYGDEDLYEDVKDEFTDVGHNSSKDAM